MALCKNPHRITEDCKGLNLTSIVEIESLRFSQILRQTQDKGTTHLHEVEKQH